MFETFQKLPDTHQGIIYILAGIIILLYALGIYTKRHYATCHHSCTLFNFCWLRKNRTLSQNDVSS